MFNQQNAEADKMQNAVNCLTHRLVKSLSFKVFSFLNIYKMVKDK